MVASQAPTAEFGPQQNGSASIYKRATRCPRTFRHHHPVVARQLCLIHISDGRVFDATGCCDMATANYWLSFTVATDRSASKGVESLRRQSIYAAVQKLDAGYWDETTSFILFEAGDDIDVVGKAVVAGLDPDLDLLILRKVSSASARCWGQVKQPTSLRGYVANIARLR